MKRRVRPVRSEPRRWRQRNVPRQWRYRLAPDPRIRRPKGVLSFWARTRPPFLVVVAMGCHLRRLDRLRSLGVGDRHGRDGASGVPVKLLLDAVGSATIGDEILKTLEKGGCQLAWYNPIRWYTIGRINHRTHRKSLIVGTTNFDSRSFAHNEENNVCFCDRGLAGRLRDTFVADLDGCDRIDLAAWSRRGVWTKTQEVFAAFLQEQT